MSSTVNPTADATIGAPKRRVGLAGAQRLGRSLMLPIAALPAAGLLLRLGQDDLLGRFTPLETVANVIAAAGGATAHPGARPACTPARRRSRMPAASDLRLPGARPGPGSRSGW